MSMGAMEKMVANMLGITPESMHKTLSDFSTLATDLKAQLDRIESALEIIHEKAATDRDDADNFNHNVIARFDALASLIEGMKNHDDGNGSKRSGGEPRKRSGASGGNVGSVNGNGDDI